MKVWTYEYNETCGVIIRSAETDKPQPGTFTTVYEARRAAVDFLREREKNLEDQLEWTRQHIVKLGNEIRRGLAE